MEDSDKPKEQLLSELVSKLVSLRQQVASLEQQIEILKQPSRSNRSFTAIDSGSLQSANYSTVTQHQLAQPIDRPIQHLACLKQLINSFAGPLTPAEVFERLLQQGLNEFAAINGWVAQPESVSGTVGIITLISADHDSADYKADRKVDQSIELTQIPPATEAIQTRQIVIVRSQPDYRQRYPEAAEHIAVGIHSLIALPLILEDQVIGAVGWNFAQERTFSENDCSFLIALAQQCVQALERAYLYEAERSAREAAEATNRVRDEFLALLSHELRSPLNPILGWTRMLRMRQLDEQMSNRALEAIERNARLQVQLIEDLLDVSHILQGKLRLNVSTVNLISVVETVLETMKLAAASKSIELDFQLPLIQPQQPEITPKGNPDQPVAIDTVCVAGDPARLQQILWNLISNAVKFTPNGGKVSVELTIGPTASAAGAMTALAQEKLYAQLTITDTGRGIEAEFLPLIFDYFRQADSTITRQFGGLGLGLTIVRHLVELHGGRIVAGSPGLDQGATFQVYLPLVQSSDRSKSVIQVTPPSLPPTIAKQLHHLRILVVEDDADMRDYVDYVLQAAGAQVALASSAGEALAKLPRFQPHVLISDIELPNVDGYRLLRQIRTLMPELGGQVPAIALTAYAGEYNQQQILAAGFQQHLTKPVEPEVLVATVSQLSTAAHST